MAERAEHLNESATGLDRFDRVLSCPLLMLNLIWRPGTTADRTAEPPARNHVITPSFLAQYRQSSAGPGIEVDAAKRHLRALKLRPKVHKKPSGEAFGDRTFTDSSPGCQLATWGSQCDWL